MPRTKRTVRQSPTTCALCGTDFLAVRADARYCSTRCRQKISRAMRAIQAIKGPAGILGERAQSAAAEKIPAGH